VAVSEEKRNNWRSASRTSMQQVAKRAGVAPSSVSRVLSGHPNVSAVMRNRVIDAVAALGYEPDLLAQSLRRGETLTVGFVVGDISNPVMSEIALGAERSLRPAGYSMLLANSIDNAELDAKHIRLFSQRRVDGLLLSISNENRQETIEAVDKAGLPVVLIDRDLRVSGPTSAVLVDHGMGITEAVRHLASLGHRRISLVNGPASLRPARERAASFRQISLQLGLLCSVRSGRINAEHGERATANLLAQAEPPTAIVVGSNQILVGVLRELRRAGKRIPNDISLITCDKAPLAEFLVPPLATIDRVPYEIGVIAASLMLELLAGTSPRTQTVSTSYVARQSVGPVSLTSNLGQKKSGTPEHSVEPESDVFVAGKGSPPESALSTNANSA
jgi:LacI family transcriptional regulator